MSGLIANAYVSDAQCSAVDALMAAVGKNVWLTDEAQMHALTAVSGSGSAYVFYLMECLVNAARDEGFTPEEAALLTEQTFCGAAQMALTTGDDLATLRAQITSPNGTTQAGLDVLMASDVGAVLKQTVAAAKARSIVMSST